MARIVELCGVPGAGKSAIFDEIKKRWTKKQNWVPADYLYAGENNTVSRIAGLAEKLKRRFTKTNGNMPGSYEDRFTAMYPEYVDACWASFHFSHPGAEDVSDPRFEKVKYLYHTINRFQFLKELVTDKLAILDEGLLHRTVNGLFAKDNREEDRAELLHRLAVMPLPYAVIYVETDAAEIAGRLLHRKKVISAHRCLDRDGLEEASRRSLERMAFAISAVERKGLPVLHIDSMFRIPENAGKIVGFVEGLIRGGCL